MMMKCVVIKTHDLRFSFLFFPFLYCIYFFFLFLCNNTFIILSTVLSFNLLNLFQVQN